MNDRASHWIKHNMQERIPPRMIVLDTESKSHEEGNVEYQEWRTGTAIRWRNDLETGRHAEHAAFHSPEQLWRWVLDYVRPGTRTVVWAHNLGHDVRISQVFTILPKIGFRLEWCNLDRNVSSMTWRSERGTLVFADTWTWIPLPLREIGSHLLTPKLRMPNDNASEEDWNRYCMRDTEIAYKIVCELVRFIKKEGLGNWQPTGAGMAYATWRHKFMAHKVLAHADTGALHAERQAMYTGRAEAWRHGHLLGKHWTEVDMRNAYLTVASECELPRKLHMHTGSLSMAQYNSLSSRFAVLCYCTVDSNVPMLPVRTDGKIVWPIGQYEGWYWDTEVDCAIRYGAKVKVKEAYVYAKAPVLREWAMWCLRVLRDTELDISSVVQSWIKHCSRALIGRLALRTPTWEPWAANQDGYTGITYVTFPKEGRTTRLLHVGEDILIETERKEGKDSLPQITSWIMAECRVRLWEAMNIIGTENIAHVDTDSIICDTRHLASLRTRLDTEFPRLWSIKGTYSHLEIFGPRAYYRDKQRVTAGIPGKATETGPGVYQGESWAGLATDLQDHAGQLVRVRQATWHLKRQDPRRTDAGGGQGHTEPLRVYASSSSADAVSTANADGLYGSSRRESFGAAYSSPLSVSAVDGSRCFTRSTSLALYAIFKCAACVRAAVSLPNTETGYR